MKHIGIVVVGIVGLFIGMCAFMKNVEKIVKVKVVGNYEYDDEYIGV